MKRMYVYLLIRLLTEQILTSTSKFTASTLTISSKETLKTGVKYELVL